jgi:uncharacterized RDD family membrane protein YckC
LSASPNTATFFPAWKQEVNRRVAAHRHRADSLLAEPEAQPGHPIPVSRASQAAARVAERYAHAPSFNETLADGARAAARAAKVASQAALEAHAAAESVLAGLQAMPPIEEPQLPFVESAASAAAPAAGPEAQQRTEPLPIDEDPWFANPFAPEQAAPSAPPAYANLIQFPREVVATRKMRPRRAEGPLAAEERTGQLSIFEVDPASVSTEPAPPLASEPAMPVWMSRELPAVAPAPLPEPVAAPPRSELPPQTAFEQPLPTARAVYEELQPEARTAFEAPQPVYEESRPVYEEPRLEAMAQPEARALPEENALDASVPAVAPKAAVEQAPLSRRLLAAVLDGTLVTATFLSMVALAVTHASQLPTSPRAAEIAAAFCLLALGVAYLVFFFAFAKATPGMGYAGVALSTFEGRVPSRARRIGRLLALPLSILPCGMGLAWALFDKGHFAWHDRISRTCLRKR